MNVTLICPIAIMLPRIRTPDKRYALNLNIYRNTHPHTLNQAKIIFKQVMQDKILYLPKYATVSAEYILFPKTKRLCDIDNITCVVNKFFQDAMVELGRIDSDDYNHWIKTTSSFGSVDKHEPRCEVILTGILKK